MRVAAVLAAALVCSAAARAATPEQAVAALRESWSAALSAQSLEGVLPLYSADALFISPEVGRVAGREAISNLFVQVFSLFRARITMTSHSVTCSGTLCVDEGVYSEQLTAKSDGSTHSLSGNYLDVVRRDADGTWRLADQMWTEQPEHPALNIPPH